MGRALAPLRPGVARGAGLAAGGLSGARPGPRRRSTRPSPRARTRPPRFGFREMLRAGAADILQPSPTKVGGLGEARKIVTLAAAWNVAVVPHSFYFGPGLAAALHLAAATPGMAWVEWPMGELATPLLATPIRPVTRAGSRRPPEPGLGGRPSVAAIARPSARRRAVARLHDWLGAASGGRADAPAGGGRARLRGARGPSPAPPARAGRGGGGAGGPRSRGARARAGRVRVRPGVRVTRGPAGRRAPRLRRWS